MAEEEKPTRRRRRSRKDSDEASASAAAEATSASEAAGASDAEVGPEAPDASASDAHASSAASVDEVDPTGEDTEAADEAADVVLEAEAEIDEDSEPEAPKRRRVRRRGADEPREATKTPRKPAPTRRRAKRDPNLPPPVVRAQARYVRSSARKARLVCDHIRGKSVQDARAILAHTPRAVARDWSKLLESAVANAENNHELVGEDLYVKAVHADEGPTIKRFRPRAMGRATRIRKRTAHLTILLTPKE
jgi:ribosomal protein L22